MANQILELLAGNALAASVLFVIAMGITLCTRNSALRNLAWTLVLLKLVTPGIVPVPIPSLLSHQAVDPAPVAQLDAEPNIRTDEANTARFGRGPVEDSPGTLSQEPPGSLRGLARWTPAAFALGVWLSGSVAIVWLSLMRIVRLRGLLSRAASISQEVNSEVSRVVASAKLGSEPRVLVIDARLSPFILPFEIGRAHV